MLENIEIKPFTDNKGEVFIPEIRSTRLFEFVEAAAKEFPEWKFVSYTNEYNYENIMVDENTKAYTKVYGVNTFDVFSNNQKLGSLCINSWSKTPYMINNERIRIMRERGEGIKSADIKKILKHMKQYFTALTLPEKIGKMIGQAENNLDDLQRTASYALRRSIEYVGDTVQDMVKDPATYRKAHALINEMGVSQETLNNLDSVPEKLVDFQNKRALMNAYKGHDNDDGKRASFVMLENSSYVFVRRDDRKNPVIRDTDSLHPDVKKALGLLKLMPDGAFLADMGMRVNENLYIVYDDLPTVEKENTNG